MPVPDKPTHQSPEEKSKAEKRLAENGLLIALCIAAVIAGYFIAKMVSRWILGAA